MHFDLSDSFYKYNILQMPMHWWCFVGKLSCMSNEQTNCVLLLSSASNWLYRISHHLGMAKGDEPGAEGERRWWSVRFSDFKLTCKNLRDVCQCQVIHDNTPNAMGRGGTRVFASKGVGGKMAKCLSDKKALSGGGGGGGTPTLFSRRTNFVTKL